MRSSCPLRALFIILTALFLLFSSSCRPVKQKPLVVLISFDGFRWDYLDKYPTPNLQWVRAQGISAESLIPVFPTKTFPNHYIRVMAFDSSRGVESPRMSYLVNRPKKEPGFGVVRQEMDGRNIRYTIHSYATDKPEMERY